jgi:hypothetical protein
MIILRDITIFYCVLWPCILMSVLFVVLLFPLYLHKQRQTHLPHNMEHSMKYCRQTTARLHPKYPVIGFILTSVNGLSVGRHEAGAVLNQQTS